MKPRWGHGLSGRQKENKISHDPETNALVERVGKRIAAAANKPEYNWEFTVIDDPKTVNAFCLPGGKIAVYTGNPASNEG